MAHQPDRLVKPLIIKLNEQVECYDILNKEKGLLYLVSLMTLMTAWFCSFLFSSHSLSAYILVLVCILFIFCKSTVTKSMVCGGDRDNVQNGSDDETK